MPHIVLRHIAQRSGFIPHIQFIFKKFRLEVGPGSTGMQRRSLYLSYKDEDMISMKGCVGIGRRVISFVFPP